MLLVMQKIISSDSCSVPQRLVDKLKRHPKRIVFTEGEDPRVLKAAAKLVKEKVAAPILLGNRRTLRSLASKHGVDTTLINFVDPKDSSDLDLFCKRLETIERYRGRRIDDPRELMSRPHNYASMMLQYGQADGMVAGNQSQPATIFRALTHFIKPEPNVPKLFGAVVMFAPHLANFGNESSLILADCGINPEPNASELSAIAVETGKLANHLFACEPRVALLSHSTRGSMNTPSANKVATATELARNIVTQQKLPIEIDGELQADVALDMQAAEVKFHDQRALKPADVLVFPNLDASHIAYKLLQCVGQAKSYGQLILGLTRQAAQVPKTTSEDMIYGTAVLIGCLSVNYRELHGLK